MQTEQAVFPISEISSYQAKWTIKARITAKSAVRTWNKNGNIGKVFSVDLLDKEGGEIRASFFNQGADAFLDKLKVGNCYTFSKGSVKVANRQYNNCNHRYELTFDKDAQVHDAADDSGIETMKIKLVDMRTVQQKTLPCNVDICGVVTSFQPSISFTSRDGKALVKREITVADDTAVSMTVTLWGDRASMDDSKFQGNPVVVVKGVLVKEWNGGRAGSLLQDGALLFDSKEPAVEKVRQWWSGSGASQQITALSVTGGGGGAGRNAKEMTFAELRQATEKLMDQAEICRVVGRLSVVQTKRQGENQPLTYMACCRPREGTNGLLCNKRVDERGFCPSCNQITEASARMNLRCNYVDFQDGMWLTTFHEGAQRVVEMSAEEVSIMEKEGESGRENLEAKLKARYFTSPMQLTIRAKLDTYNGELRPNVSCIDAQPVKHGEHGRKMLSEIRNMLAAAGA